MSWSSWEVTALDDSASGRAGAGRRPGVHVGGRWLPRARRTPP